MATYDTDSLEAPDAQADVGEYSRHHEWQHCPRCRGETFGRRACPLCGLDLNDATLAAAEAGVQRARTRQRLGLAAIGLVLLTALAKFAAPVHHYRLRTVDLRQRRRRPVTCRLLARRTGCTPHHYHARRMQVTRHTKA